MTEGVFITSGAMAGSLEERIFEITADAWSQRALEPWFTEKDSPFLLSTVSSHSLEQDPWGSGSFLKGRVRAPCAYGQVTSLTLCPAREGAMFVAAAGGAGSDWILQELQSAWDSCLSGWACSRRQHSLRSRLPVSPASRLREASRGDQGEGETPRSQEDHPLP